MAQRIDGRLIETQQRLEFGARSGRDLPLRVKAFAFTRRKVRDFLKQNLQIFTHGICGIIINQEFQGRTPNSEVQEFGVRPWNSAQIDRL